MATKSAPKKHPDHVVARAAAEEGEVDPLEGVAFITLETGIRIPVPDTHTYHPMDLSANPAVVAGTPSYLIDEEAPLSTSPRNSSLMMLPDDPPELRVEQYNKERDALKESLQAQIDLATAALAAMDAVPDPPAPPAPELESIDPTSIIAGDPPVLITATGTNFAGATIWADEEAQNTTYVSDTELTYMGQADQAGTQTITVRSGSATSSAIEMTVDAGAGRSARVQDSEPEPGFPPPDDKKE